MLTGAISVGTSKRGFKDPAELPLGAVVAICRLEMVWKIEKESFIPPGQAPYGDFTPGRYAWDLVEVDRLPAGTSEWAAGAVGVVCAGRGYR